MSNPAARAVAAHLSITGLLSALVGGSLVYRPGDAAGAVAASEFRAGVSSEPETVDLL